MKTIIRGLQGLIATVAVLVAPIAQGQLAVVMVSPETGKRITFTQPSAAEVATHLEALQVQESSWVKKCELTQEDPQMLEISLELEFMIDALNSEKIPMLSSYQKEYLKGVPLCDSLLMDLKTISMLLQKYKIVSRQQSVAAK